MSKRKASTAFAQKKTSPPKKTKTTGKDYNAGRTHPSQPKAELKAYDVAFVTSNFGVAQTGAFVATLNAMTQGTEVYQRVGRKTYNKNLHFIGGIYPQAALATNSYCRVIIFYDSQPNAAYPATFTTLLQDSNAGAGLSVLSRMNISERERFKILRDKYMLVGGVTAAGVQNVPDSCHQANNLNEFIDLKGIETTYNATNGGTIADITSGSLVLALISDGTNGDVQLTWSTRLRYYD